MENNDNILISELTYSYNYLVRLEVINKTRFYSFSSGLIVYSQYFGKLCLPSSGTFFTKQKIQKMFTN